MKHMLSASIAILLCASTATVTPMLHRAQAAENQLAGGASLRLPALHLEKGAGLPAALGNGGPEYRDSHWHEVETGLRTFDPRFATTIQGPTQSSDEATVRDVVERFLSALRVKDEKGAAALWSANKADHAEDRVLDSGSNRSSEKIEIEKTTVVQVRLDGDKARVRVSIEVRSSDSKSAGTQAGSKKLNRTFSLAKENGQWRLLNCVPSEQELAAQIGAAKSEAERERLVMDNEELATTSLVSALLREASGLMRQGSIDEASGVLHLSAELAAKLGEKRMLAISYGNLARCHEIEGSYADALDYAKKTIEAARQTTDKRLLCHALWTAGFDDQLLGNFPEALEFLHESLSIAEPASDTMSISWTLENLAAVHSRQGRYSEAIQELLKSLEYAQKNGDPLLAGGCLHDLGTIEFHQGDIAQARDYFQKSLALAKSNGNQQAIAMSLDEIGSVEAFDGNIPEAIKEYQESLTIAKSIGDREHAGVALHNLGSVYDGQRDYENALRCHQDAMKVAKETGDQVFLADTLGNIADVYYAQGKYDQALKTAEEADSLAVRIGDLETIAQVRTTAGKAYRSLNQPENARRSFVEAINAVEKLRGQIGGAEQDRQRFLELRIGPYEEMASLLVEQHDAFGALSYAEQAKARTLVETLQPGRVKITKAMTAREKQKEDALTDRLNMLNAEVISQKAQSHPDEEKLASLDSELAKAQVDFDRFQAELSAVHPELRTQRGEFQSITSKQLLDLIPDTKVALLEYLVTEDKTCLFAITRRASAQDAPDVQVFELNVGRSDLKQLAQRLRKSLEDRDLAVGEQAHALYDLLLKPAAQILAGKQELVIVPDDVLWGTPFQALESRQTRFLIEDFAISYAPSFTALREMSRLRASHSSSPKPPVDLLALGNPTIGKETVAVVNESFRNERLEPLPWAEREVKTLQEVYGPRRSEVYVENQATEEKLKAEAANCRILHLATHGIMNDSNPLHSQIVLARDPEGADDGALEAWEIMDLNLKADLVVLSACETGRGQIRSGEGVIGLSWAVFVAGCPSTVVSQWKVESESTAILMVAFHRNLLSGKSKTQALREAELQMLKSPTYGHPFYWAPFVVVGNAN